MSTIIQPNFEAPSPSIWSDQGFTVDIHREGDRCVVRVAGELDLATRDRLFLACTGGHHPRMVIDISRLTFMDCSGYASIVAARNLVEADARTLGMRGEIGQPARLLHLIADLERKSRSNRPSLLAS